MSNDVPQEEDLKAPPRLIEALRQASSERIFVPPAIDRTILKAAERQFSHSGRGRARRVWWWTGLATASAVVVAFALVTSQWQRVAKGRFALEDVNHDGKIDILDASHWPGRLNREVLRIRDWILTAMGSLMRKMS